MEGRGPKMWQIFSITHSQYLELSMKLDLRSNAPRAKDWTEFAEWIGNYSQSCKHFDCMCVCVCVCVRVRVCSFVLYDMSP